MDGLKKELYQGALAALRNLKLAKRRKMCKANFEYLNRQRYLLRRFCQAMQTIDERK